MKPFPLRIGTGTKLQKLLETYGNFPLYKEGQQTTDQVRLELLPEWDQEQFADLRATVPDDNKSFKVADWLIVTAGAERLKEVENFINVFAAGVPQIEIEAKIVEVTTTDTLDLGVRPIDTSTPIFGFPDHTFVQSLTYTLPNSAAAANSLLGLSAVQDGVTFNAILQMLQTYDNVSIISRPKIAVREGGAARIVNTVKLPSYSVNQVQANGQAAANLTYEEVGIKLYVVPRVVGTQTVALNIDIEASAQSGNAATFTLGNSQVISNPIISRRAAQTVVYLEPGQAVILGGLVSERTVDTENKVPILGSIPLLNYFFKSTLKRKEQANVLFFIRPRILTGSDMNREF
ncbi:MAG: type II and III secretion system protein [Planctomycetes bacterium]|nr:type II and III secretion system protein [Planctomycetota bacterium]